MTTTMVGTGNGAVKSPLNGHVYGQKQHLRLSEDGIRQVAGALKALKLDLSRPVRMADKRRLARRVNYSVATVAVALSELRRRAAVATEAELLPVEPASVLVAVEGAPAPEAAPAEPVLEMDAEEPSFEGLFGAAPDWQTYAAQVVRALRATRVLMFCHVDWQVAGRIHAARAALQCAVEMGAPDGFPDEGLCDLYATVRAAGILLPRAEREGEGTPLVEKMRQEHDWLESRLHEWIEERLLQDATGEEVAR